MLMITVDAQADVVTLRLTGRLAGPEARELARNWSTAAFKEPHQEVWLDLAGLTAVDAIGLEFLAQAHRNGDRLVGGATPQALIGTVPKG
jgi:anti-anti-sigma regulatory factor